jgi:hypothetical protein
VPAPMKALVDGTTREDPRLIDGFLEVLDEMELYQAAAYVAVAVDALDGAGDDGHLSATPGKRTKVFAGVS